MPNIQITAAGAPALPLVASAEITLRPAAQNDTATTKHTSRLAPDINLDTPYRFASEDGATTISRLVARSITRDDNAVWTVNWQGVGVDGASHRIMTDLDFMRADLELRMDTGGLPHLINLDNISRSRIIDLLIEDMLDVSNLRSADRVRVAAEYQLAISAPPGASGVIRSLVAGNRRPKQPELVMSWEYNEPIDTPPEFRRVTCYHRPGRRVTYNADTDGADFGLPVERDVDDLPTARVECMLQYYRMRARWRTAVLSVVYNPEWSATDQVDYEGADAWIVTEVKHLVSANSVSVTTLALTDMPVLPEPPFIMADA